MHINILHKAEKVVLAVQKNAYCDERVMLEWINEVGKPSVTFCRVLLFDSLKVHMVSTVRTQLEDAMTDVEFVLPGEWAREKFALEKAPGKSSVKRILNKESSLKLIAADFRCRKQITRASMVALDSCLVEMVLYAEQVHVSISWRMLMIFGRLYAEALHIPVSERPRFTRDGWLKHFLRRYGLRHRRGHGEIGSVDLPAARKAGY
ncbi:hypothetical protein PF004_g4418 [Phytophthora fragariae]|uniref:HTH CENPB-type domain-containing protein n=1 Tax=Phytophthora fragariae TaxID=53985 RepID=A0A6G0PJ34_9STRA|nr:hypothetical protein PF004_g4418 [Phytophthora fragariae]